LPPSKAEKREVDCIHDKGRPSLLLTLQKIFTNLSNADLEDACQKFYTDFEGKDKYKLLHIYDAAILKVGDCCDSVGMDIKCRGK